MKIWMDDVRKAPAGYVRAYSVNNAKDIITVAETSGLKIEVLDLDHDMGDYAYDGGDGIRLLDWLEATGRSYPIHIHSMNPVGVGNMYMVAEHNHWKIV